MPLWVKPKPWTFYMGILKIPKSTYLFLNLYYAEFKYPKETFS